MLIRFFAAARAAVGTDEVRLPGAVGSLGDALDAVEATTVVADPARWTALQARCSFLLDGVSTRDRSASIDGVVMIDVMPPFAGG